MSDGSNNSVISTEELEAAIAEIESLSPREKEQIPDLDDGRSDEGEAGPAPAPPAGAVVPIPVPTGAPRAPSSEEGAPAQAASAESAASESDSSFVADGPSDEGDAAARPGRRPVRRLLAWLAGLVPLRDWIARLAGVSLLRRAAALVARGCAVPRRILGRLPWPARSAGSASEGATAPETAPAADVPTESADDESAAPAGVPLWLRAVDRLLGWVNAPFAWVPEPARQILGLAGIVTIIVSIAALFLLPLLLPQHDAISFIHQKLAEQRVAPPTEP